MPLRTGHEVHEGHEDHVEELFFMIFTPFRFFMFLRPTRFARCRDLLPGALGGLVDLGLAAGLVLVGFLAAAHRFTDPATQRLLLGLVGAFGGTLFGSAARCHRTAW